jgi:hypothetical protein
LHLDYLHPKMGPVTGSGILLTSDGYFLTNHHVLDADHPGVQLKMHGMLDGEQTYWLGTVRRLWADESYDLVLGRCEVPPGARQDIARGLHPPVLAHENGQRGEELRIFGFKYEVTEERTGVNFAPKEEVQLCTAGHLHLAPTFATGGEKKAWYSQAEVEPGFSGGPVVLARTGELLGITTAALFDDLITHNTNSYAHIYTNHEAIREFISHYIRHARIKQ